MFKRGCRAVVIIGSLTDDLELTLRATTAQMGAADFPLSGEERRVVERGRAATARVISVLPPSSPHKV